MNALCWRNVEFLNATDDDAYVCSSVSKRGTSGLLIFCRSRGLARILITMKRVIRYVKINARRGRTRHKERRGVVGRPHKNVVNGRCPSSITAGVFTETNGPVSGRGNDLHYNLQCSKRPIKIYCAVLLGCLVCCLFNDAVSKWD
jgi:hypothetical protein